MTTVIYATGADFEPAREWAARQHPVVWVTRSEIRARTDAANGYRVIAVGGPALRDLRDVPGVEGIVGTDLHETCAKLAVFALEEGGIRG